MPSSNEFNLRDHMRVVLKDATIEVGVGMHPWEKHPERPSRLRISVDLFVPLKPGPSSIQKPVVDYDHIRSFVLGLQKRPHTELLETLLDEIVAVCFDDPRVDACRVAILKPDIFNEADAAGIEVYRTRAGWSAR